MDRPSWAEFSGLPSADDGLAPGCVGDDDR